mgnify:CR=1 FL=1
MNIKNKKIVNETIFETFQSLNGEIDESWGPDQIQDWDSLNHLNLVMALGKKFDVTLEFEEVMSIETVGDIFRVLNEKGIK